MVATKSKGLVLNPKIGADPEVFVYAEDLEMILPSFDLVGGTKENPRALKNKGFFIQEDNVLVEYNIPVSLTREGFVENIHKGLELISEELPQGFKPALKSSHRFHESLLTDPRAFIMGCEPDYNVYLGRNNDKPDLSEDPFLRSAGGHIHIGYDDSSARVNKLLIRILDAYLGIPSVILDQDTDRRKLYGKAGACRHKNYGVEYRTLSSFWLGSKELTGWVWDQTMLAIEKLNNRDVEAIKNEAFIVNTINTGNVNDALHFVKERGIVLP